MNYVRLILKIQMKEIQNLKKLYRWCYCKIIKRIPYKLMIHKHKEYLILYLMKRRDIFLEIKGEERKNNKKNLWMNIFH